MDRINSFRRRRTIQANFPIFLALTVLTHAMVPGQKQLDAREGATAYLECRVTPPSQKVKYYWYRHVPGYSDVVALGAIPLGIDYELINKPEESKYDLRIKNVSYQRDNGKFECGVKVVDMGTDIHNEITTLTVLRAPGPPAISLTSAPATEGKRLELQCNTNGGNPEPQVTWYRGGNGNPLHEGRTLVITPSKEDDRANFRCVVWNRAMPKGQTLDATVTLNVNYFPSVTVGPENPLKVEANRMATLVCDVDSKPKVGSVQWMRVGSIIATNFRHVIPRVTLEDAGTYTCLADNGFEQKGESSLTLDVLYPPIVAIERGSIREADVEDSVTIHCTVSANPAPSSVEWSRDGYPEFRQFGKILRLSRVTVDDAGKYTCGAVNTIHSTGSESREHFASALVVIWIRHKPGPARITPDSPVAAEGSRVILTCMAQPSGWPDPQYKWWREGEGARDVTREIFGPKYIIDSAHLGSEGTYKCLATNKIGNGEAAYVKLTVHQAPKFMAKLQPHVTRKVGESLFSVSCTAQGKPKPTVRWLKDDVKLTAGGGHYEVRTEATEGRSDVTTVHTILEFVGLSRPQTDEIIPNDRGKYTCVFDNEVERIESTMMLKVEHAPIALHQDDKVAYSLNQTTEIACKVQAWPKPDFQWSFGTNTAPLQMSSDGHYKISTTSDKYDVYTSVLRVSDITQRDYGEYSCRVANGLGNIISTIHLQFKEAPDKPTRITAMDVGPSHVALLWEPGSHDGLPNTKFFVSYQRAASSVEVVAPDCAVPRPAGQWLDYDCRGSNPCNVTSLDQHQSYSFKVKAYNTKGNSEYSEDISATTAVAKIPAPHRVSYDPESGTLAVNVGATCLALVAAVEKSEGLDTWRLVDVWQLEVLGSAATQREGRLELETGGPELKIRVRLCLKADHQKCGEYTDAETQSGALATPTLIALAVSGAAFLLFAALLVLLYCRCRRKHAAKAKDYEMDSNAVRPSLVTGNGQETQAPPPHYAENKTLEHSPDLALAVEDPKSPADAQPGYHQPNHNINGKNDSPYHDVSGLPQQYLEDLDEIRNPLGALVVLMTRASSPATQPPTAVAVK